MTLAIPARNLTRLLRCALSARLGQATFERARDSFLIPFLSNADDNYEVHANIIELHTGGRS